jgi:uncharacterized membrane protein
MTGILWGIMITLIAQNCLLAVAVGTYMGRGK